MSVKEENKEILLLEEFWVMFARLSPAISNIQLPYLPSLIVGLNSYFGRLTSHSVENENSEMMTILCRNCRNCNMDIKKHVCETHCGVIAGTVEFQLNGKVTVSNMPNIENGLCRIHISKIC